MLYSAGDSSDCWYVMVRIHWVASWYIMPRIHCVVGILVEENIGLLVYCRGILWVVGIKC